VNKSIWIIFFIVALAVNLVGILLENELLQYISKPLLVPILAAYFMISTRNRRGFAQGLLPALLFAWIANVLLLFTGKDEIFFLLGLSASLLAHIFYIIFFNRVRIQENISGRWWIIVFVIIYYAVMMYSLSYKMKDLTIPIRIFGVVICFMCMLAMHMLFLVNKRAGIMMMSGGMLFIVSDSLLGFNKFNEPFLAADFLIIFFYGMAQLFIVRGAVDYITSEARQ
jgi:uncharacterized membrane protein YhhN